MPIDLFTDAGGNAEWSHVTFAAEAPQGDAVVVHVPRGADAETVASILRALAGTIEKHGDEFAENEAGGLVYRALIPAVPTQEAILLLREGTAE